MFMQNPPVAITFPIGVTLPLVKKKLASFLLFASLNQSSSYSFPSTTTFVFKP